ncbi:unnamed protein product, partial [Oppiella nova]
KFDCDLENKFKILKETDRLKELSQHIHHIFVSMELIPENSRLLLSAWKDFLISIARFDPFNISKESKKQEWHSSMEQLLRAVDDVKENLSFNTLNSIETSVIKYLQLFTTDFNSSEFMVYSAKLLNQSLRVIEKQIKSPKS